LELYTIPNIVRGPYQFPRFETTGFHSAAFLFGISAVSTDEWRLAASAQDEGFEIDGANVEVGE
jgi:hypothetical protein